MKILIEEKVDSSLNEEEIKKIVNQKVLEIICFLEGLPFEGDNY